VLRVLPCAPIIQQATTSGGQFQCLIEFPVREQARIGGNVSAMKFQLQPSVKTNSQRLFFAVTHWILRFPLLQQRRKPLFMGLN
jgi:hypothetical protein